MAKKRLVYSPRAREDLLRLEKKNALQILDDLPILENPPWPHGKVKRLKGTDLWEVNTGDFKSIFWLGGDDVVILRVVNRRDLELTLGRIDVRSVARWLRGNRK